MNTKKNKKGISPLIATVLIIGFTIVLAALVISWGTTLFKKTTEETGKTSEFNLLCSTGYDTEVTATKSGATIDVVAKNQNEKAVPGFLFVIKATDETTTQFFVASSKTTSGVTATTGTKVYLNGGNTGVAPGDASLALGPFGTNRYTLTPNGNPPAGGWAKIDVRTVAQTEAGDVKVCDSVQTLKLA